MRKKEYNYDYDAGKIVRATECDIELREGIITSRKVIHSIRYTYDQEDKLVKKVIAPLGGTVQTVYYEHSEDDSTISRFTAGNRTVTSHSKTDSFGRKVFDELQLGTGFVSREFRYLQGDVPDEHKTHEKLKSSPTTQLVSEILFADGRKISYAYDAEERITEVVDSLEGTTKYTYDALGQLETETANGVTTKFVYDHYGNIIAKGLVDETGEIVEDTKITYEYGDDTWKDLLTSYNGQSITYDAQGNPVQYLGHTLTWEKGRQLKSFDGNTYTYNANGIRTGKTVDGILHTYTLDGTKILRETWCENTLVPLYDNEDSVCGIVYNNVPYFFYKNLQGDVIGITDQDANIVARYTYDAWGVCTIVEDRTDCNIATVNPFRYRGYYYDEEIGLYYLQSRYYNPRVGRFVNGDSKLGVNIGVQSYALYCYCGNEPVFRNDTLGYAWWRALHKRELVPVVAAIIGVVTVAHVINAGLALSQANYNKSHDTQKIVSDQHRIDMKLGCKTFAAMGCGAAATHNAIILAGGSSSLADVVEFMQTRDLTLGFAGVYFTNIQLYLRRKGYSNRISLMKLKNNIDRKIKSCKRKIAILAYKGSKGHYVAIKYKESDEKFYVYNNNQTISSVDAWIKDDSYLPLCLITI